MGYCYWSYLEKVDGSLPSLQQTKHTRLVGKQHSRHCSSACVFTRFRALDSVEWGFPPMCQAAVRKVKKSDVRWNTHAVILECTVITELMYHRLQPSHTTSHSPKNVGFQHMLAYSTHSNTPGRMQSADTVWNVLSVCYFHLTLDGSRVNVPGSRQTRARTGVCSSRLTAVLGQECAHCQKRVQTFHRQLAWCDRWCGHDFAPGC